MVAASIMGAAIRPRRFFVKMQPRVIPPPPPPASNRAPQPLGDLRDHVAEQQQRG